MTLNEFVSKYEGKTVGYPNDNSYKGECVSLAKWYIKEVFGFNPPSTGANAAYGYWTNFPNPLGDYFIKVENTREAVINPGDIPIWDSKVGNGYGHIAICVTGGIDDFESLDQNWGGKQAHIVKHNFSNIYGWLRPKVNMTQVTLDSAKFEELVTKASKYDAFLAAGYGNPDFVTQTIEDYKRQLDGVRSERDVANQTVEERRKEWSTLIASLAQSLDTRQDAQEIKDKCVILGNIESKYDDLNTKYSKERASWAVVEQELRAEIARMDAVIKQTNILENLTAEQIFLELLKRLRKLLRLV